MSQYRDDIGDIPSSCVAHTVFIYKYLWYSSEIIGLNFMITHEDVMMCELLSKKG